MILEQLKEIIGVSDSNYSLRIKFREILRLVSYE